MSDETSVFFITTFTAIKDWGYGRPHRQSRCVGYRTDRDLAIDAVKMNAGDIHEAGYYPLCLVEELGEGIYPQALSYAWFEWIEGVDAYRQIDGPPEDLERQCGFSIG